MMQSCSTSVISVRKSRSKRKEWNQFSRDSHSSYRTEYNAIKFPNNRRQMFARFYRLDVFAGDTKIAQCGLFKYKTDVYIADRLQVATCYASLESLCLQAVARYVGTGTYAYGSEWSVGSDLTRGLENTKAEKRKEFFVQSVDFSNWKSWEAYYESISKNAKRNCRKAEIENPGIGIREVTGIRLLGILPSIYRLRQKSFSRKARTLGWSRFLKTFVRTLFLSDIIRVRFVVVDGKYAAYTYCIEYGSNTYYIEGGFDEKYAGVSWYNLIYTIERAYKSVQGRGKFIMGPIDEASLQSLDWQGLVRSREQCRAELEKTVTFSFDYENPHAGCSASTDPQSEAAEVRRSRRS